MALPTLILMARPAVPGRCKTRLLTRLRPVDAARVQACCTRALLARLPRVLRGRVGRLGLAIDAAADFPEPGEPRRKAWGFDPGPEWEIVPQHGENLGARLAHAWERFGAGPVILLGTDAPDLPAGQLRRAVRELARHDVVIGPAEDGGYWTLGARQLCIGLFKGIDWGTANVYHQTLLAARTLGLSAQPLGVWSDVDTPTDLDGLIARLRGRGPGRQDPALMALLLELETLGKDTDI